QARGGVLTPDLLPMKQTAVVAESFGRVPEASLQAASVLKTLNQVEAEHIQQVLNHTGGHKGKSCDILGISRPALDRKIKKYALTLP
ncbi:MAG: sigma-54-dependent Fis family transcriptional regulator, partial [Gammaproteobacteria bacterium]|nr:sigma-54-dependent Fis family transcriptional regulator [Gammaproteobacteria bacterium]